ncbi:hypothetical protein CJO79_22400 (plasmid) [Ralstonia solanacearum]|nr:hypothetical protein CJO76_22420 [Ralstonia solanacearum]AXV94079.1 hypothetical protein CJO79_22400 [Ralstonia solanacearum]AXW22077.1 hypothetical protein CJO85_22515 [Ralstonia solanacearum]AXW78976.1 hypothetical protein CJO97_22400 [Ralstonia solanacearum]
MARTLCRPGRQLLFGALPLGRFGGHPLAALRMRSTWMACGVPPVRHRYALALWRMRALRIAPLVRATRQTLE